MVPQPNRVKREVRFENQLKTSEPLLLTLRYDRPPPTRRTTKRPA
jgi:hypothetical protein